MAFFASTFCAIVALLIYNTATHADIDYSLTYRRAGLPIGLAVMAIAFVYLGTLWLKRILRKSSPGRSRAPRRRPFISFAYDRLCRGFFAGRVSFAAALRGDFALALARDSADFGDAAFDAAFFGRLGAGGGDGGLEFGVEVGDGDGGGGFAQALEAVEGALLGGEDVDDEVDVVHQDPLGLAAAFDGVGVGAELAFEAELDLVGDGDVLAVVGAVADEEVVGEAALGGVEGEDADVFGLFVFAGCGCGEQELIAFG